MCKLIIGLIDLIQIDKVVLICFNWEKEEVLFTVIQCLSYRTGTKKYKNKFISAMYKKSIAESKLHISLRLQASFESIILGSSANVLPTLLESLNNPFFMDVKIAMIKTFLPRIQFVHVDMLINRLFALVTNAQS